MAYWQALIVLLTFVSTFLLSYVLIGMLLREWDYRHNYEDKWYR